MYYVKHSMRLKFTTICDLCPAAIQMQVYTHQLVDPKCPSLCCWHCCPQGQGQRASLAAESKPSQDNRPMPEDHSHTLSYQFQATSQTGMFVACERFFVLGHFQHLAHPAWHDSCRPHALCKFIPSVIHDWWALLTGS